MREKPKKKKILNIFNFQKLKKSFKIWVILKICEFSDAAVNKLPN